MSGTGVDVGNELTQVSGTGIDVVPKLPKGMKVCTGFGGTGIHIVRKLPKCPLPVLKSYRS